MIATKKTALTALSVWVENNGVAILFYVWYGMVDTIPYKIQPDSLVHDNWELFNPPEAEAKPPHLNTLDMYYST